ncbi:ATP-binding protein [Thermodesulfobacteriota bacterium]
MFKKKSQLEAILSAIGEGIIIIDLNNKVTYQNDKAREMFGDFISKNCYSIYQSDDSPCSDCPAARSIDTDSTKRAVHKRIDENGSLRYYELTAAPVKEDGKVIASVEIIRDITERKGLKDDLQRTTRRLQTVISKMNNGLLYANRHDEVAIANETALSFFSTEPNEDLSKITGNDNRKDLLLNTIKVFRNDTNVSYYEKTIEHDGSFYNVRFSASRSADSEYYGTIANIVDITNMKNLESLKEDLTHMIVHDMKHPLNTILYVLELAAEGMMMEDVAPADKELLNIAHKDSKILLTMIQSMLDISKMQEGESILNKKNTFYKNTIKTAIAEVEFLSTARKIKVQERHNAKILSLMIDDDYIERVIINLLSNAIKFSAKGHDIIVTTEDHEQNGVKFVKINVINEGPVIPKEAIPTIFDKYTQAEHRASGKIAATGLGLTFCHLAVESHGGRIWVESPPEEFVSGAKFSFTIPVQEE